MAVCQMKQTAGKLNLIFVSFGRSQYSRMPYKQFPIVNVSEGRGPANTVTSPCVVLAHTTRRLES